MSLLKREGASMGALGRGLPLGLIRIYLRWNRHSFLGSAHRLTSHAASTIGAS